MRNNQLVIFFVTMISACLFLYACSSGSSNNVDSVLEQELRSKLDGASKQERFTELSYRYGLYKSNLQNIGALVLNLKKNIKSVEDALKTSKAMGRDGAEHQSTLEEFNKRMVNYQNEYSLSKAKLETVIKLANKYDISKDTLGK